MFKKFIKDTRGATSIEYAVIASLIGVAIIGGVTSLGSANENNYNNIQQEVTNAG